MTRISWCLPLALLIATASCSDADKTKGGNDGPPPGETTGAAIAGLVTERSGTPIEGAFVSAYGEEATTDASGRFRIDGLILPKARVVISIQREGYFDLTTGARPTSDDGTMNFSVVLLPKEKLGEIDNATGGKVSNDDVSVEAPANAFVSAAGEPVIGAVTLFAAFLDPTSETFTSEMPGGDMYAENDMGEEGVLVSFGAVLLDARDEEENDVRPTEEITSCVALPEELRDSAPEEIPVWVMEDGAWAEAGTATRSGDQYCFVTTTFGAINCDIFSRSAIVSGRVCDENGEVVAAEEVRIGQLTTRTSDDGSFSALIPAKSPLSLESEHGSATVCTVEPNSTVEVDLGACPEARLGDEECTSGSTWTDAETGITWQLGEHPELSWEAAKEHCASLTQAGGGWHLPTIDELRTLIRGCTESSPMVCDTDTCIGAHFMEISSCGCNGCGLSDGPTNGHYYPAELELGQTLLFWSATQMQTEADVNDTWVWGVNFRFGNLQKLTNGAFAAICAR